MVAHGGIGLGEAHGGEDHCGEHCPFLNRSDHRCSDKLRLDHIDHAFDYCFGEYKACPVYLEQLAERRVRRLCGLLTPPDTDAGRSVEPGRSDRADVHRTSTRRPLVQLTVAPRPVVVGAHAHRYPQHAAGVALLPASPRL